MFFFRVLLMLFACLLVALPCSAKIYKYQKDGVWYFTDAPPKETIPKSEVIQDTEEITRKLMVGTWYGYTHDYLLGMDVTRHWISTFYANGKHISKSRSYLRGTERIVAEHVRYGKWFYKDGSYHYECEYLVAEGGRVTRSYKTTYELVDLTATRMVYRSAGSGTTYTSKRVKPDYDF